LQAAQRTGKNWVHARSPRYEDTRSGPRRSV
jgi:hypothetical protein